MRRLRLREAVKNSSPHSDRSKNGSLILNLNLKYMFLTSMSYIWSAVYKFHSSIQQLMPWNALFFTSSCPWKTPSHPLRLSSPAVSSLRFPHFLHIRWITSLLCCMAGGTLYPVWLCGVGFPTGLQGPSFLDSWSQCLSIPGPQHHQQCSEDVGTQQVYKFFYSFIHSRNLRKNNTYFSFLFNPSCTNSRYHSPAQPPLVSLCIYSIKCKSLSTAFRGLCDEMVIHFEVSWATFYVPLALPDLCHHHLLSSCLCSYCSLLLNCSLPPSVFPLKVLSFLQYPSSNITSPGKPSLISWPENPSQLCIPRGLFLL